VHNGGGKLIVIEADKTIVVERAKTIALAKKLGITIVALDESQLRSSFDVSRYAA
jgi:DUF1009 family protein